MTTHSGHSAGGLPPARGPLSGVVVIDLSDSSAVFGTRILADLGCDVIRVEPPGGDGLRRLAPFAGDPASPDASLLHFYHNAGKRSVTLDRATEAGRTAFWELLAGADVIVETERLDPRAVARCNPSAVQVTVSPFGLEGPRRDWRATDIVAAAAGGLAFVCGETDHPPAQPGADQASKLAGMAAAVAAVIAVTGRDRTSGRPGVHIDVSMQDVVAGTVLQTANPSYWAWRHEVPARPGLGRVYQCGDGNWVTLAVRPSRREAFLRWAERIGAVDADGIAVLTGQSPASPEADAVLREVVGAVSREQIMAAIIDLDLMGLPVSTLDDLGEWEAAGAVAPFEHVRHPGLARTLRFPPSPVGDLAVRDRGPAPAPGEHNRHVLPPARRPDSPPAPGLGRLELSTALAGIRVVDFCWMIAGPLGTRFLSDFGAEVIRVEAGPRAYPDTFPPGLSDPSVGAFHNNLNTGKRSVAIDPRTQRGRELLLDLIAQADVVTNNYRPPAFENLGFTDELLRERNPRLINLHIPGTGRTGPWSRIGTFGTMIAAAAGLNWLTGFPGGAPRGLGTAYSDFTTPYLVPLMILPALRERERTGVGRTLELNQLTATIALLGVEWLQNETGRPPGRRANLDPNYCPHGIYRAEGSDEWIALTATDDGQFRSLCEVIGHPELAASMPSVQDRMSGRHAIDAAIEEWTAAHGKWDAAEILQANGIPAAPVENLRDAMETDPGLSQRHYFTVEQPSHPGISIPVQNTPIQAAGELRYVRRAPAYGADNAYVLEEILGLTPAEVEKLRQDGIVGP